MTRGAARKSSEFVVLFSTNGSMEEASRIAESLVEKHLVACVNIVPSIHSVYWWDNKVNHDYEVLLIIKTERSMIPQIEKSIRSLHSYQTPELIALPLVYGLPEYLKWMKDALPKQQAKSTK